MATGDISSPAISSNGKQATFTVDSLTGASVTASAGDLLNITFDCTSEGYTGTTPGTKSRTGIRCLFSGATGTTVTVDLEEPIHDDCTSVVMDATSGAITDGTVTSNAATDLATTNNSTLDYATAFGIVVSKVYEKVTGSFDVDVVAGAGAYKGHRSNFGIAAVEVTAHEPIAITGLIGTWTNGETITGGTSGATAEIIDTASGKVYVRKQSGTWSAAETITGGSSGATAIYLSGGRTVTKTATSLTAADAIGTRGWKDTIQVFRCSFDVSSGGGDWASGFVNKDWVTIDAKAYPKIGDAASVRTAPVELMFANPADDYDTVEKYCDPTGTFTLSVATSGALSIGEGLVGDTSGAEAVVNQAYASGVSSLSISYVRGTWSGTESFTSHTGVTGTISSISYNGSDSFGTGTLANPYQTMIKALKECENSSTDNTASWSTIYVKAGRSFMGPYAFANYTTTKDGPVNITRAPGVAEADAVISGSADSGDTNATDGLRTHLIRVHDIKVDFKYYNDPLGLDTNQGYYQISTGSAPDGGLISSGNGAIFENVVFEGRGRLLDGSPDVFWHEKAFERLGLFLYGCSFTDFNDACAKARVARDCEVVDCSGDWIRPFDANSVFDRSRITTTDNLGNIAINNRISLNAQGTGTHCDVWQFVGTGTTNYENVGFYQNLAYDLDNVQIGPFYNGANTGISDTTSRINSMFMALNVQEPDDNTEIGQLDDCFVRGAFVYNNSFGDTLLLRNNYKQQNAWWVRNYFAELAEDATGLLENTGYIDNHNADLFTYTAVSADGFDNTTGGSVAALFDDFDTTYKPKVGGALDARGYTDPIMTSDADASAWRTDGSASITAIQSAATEDITGQVQVDGTIRLTSQRASGLWGSVITKDDTKITLVSQVTGGTRAYSVGSVTGAGTSTLQVILTPTPLIYSVAAGGTVTVTIGEGWLTDENGNTTAAYSGIADGDNSSTQVPSGGGGNATKGNFGIHTGIKIGV